LSRQEVLPLGGKKFATSRLPKILTHGPPQSQWSCSSGGSCARSGENSSKSWRGIIPNFNHITPRSYLLRTYEPAMATESRTPRRALEISERLIFGNTPSRSLWREVGPRPVESKHHARQICTTGSLPMKTLTARFLSTAAAKIYHFIYFFARTAGHHRPANVKHKLWPKPWKWLWKITSRQRVV